MQLETGARLTLPPGATRGELKNQSAFPQEVKRTQIFHLGDERRILMIGEMALEGRSCDAVIGEQLAKARQARGDSDPRRVERRRVAAVEAIEIAGQRAIYSESQHKGFGPDATARPFVGMANVVFCRDGDYVMVMYASDQPPPTGGPRKVVVDVAQSYRPAPKK